MKTRQGAELASRPLCALPGGSRRQPSLTVWRGPPSVIVARASFAILRRLTGQRVNEA
jgi:hypothetical protein